MNRLTVVALAVFFTLLTACTPSLPVRSDDVAEGILAIPKSMRTEVSFNSGWVTDLEIRDDNGEVVGDLVRLHPINGRQFVFLKNLAPGNYTVSGLRRVGAGENARGSSSPIQPIGNGIPFIIIDGEVTVLPVIFHVNVESTGPHSGFSRLNFVPLEGEERQKFQTVMDKANKNGDWSVYWP